MKHKILEYEIDISQIHNPQLSRAIRERLDELYLFGWNETTREWDDTTHWTERYSEEKDDSSWYHKNPGSKEWREQAKKHNCIWLYFT